MKEKKKKCKTKFCRGKTHGTNVHCSKCSMRIWRAKYPGHAAYLRKKWNAQVKGIPFTLTLDEFQAVWVPGHVIDRKNALEGYHNWNIQALTSFQNNSKATADKAAHAAARKNGKARSWTVNADLAKGPNDPF